MAHLLTPGPVPLPAEVVQALQRPVMPHRSAGFETFYRELLDKIASVFITRQRVATMIGSGTYGLEAAMYSLFSPGAQVLVVNMGKFSGRWAAYAPLLGLELIVLEKPWGEAPTSAELLKKAASIPGLKGVVLTHCETSTGALVDLEECAFSLRRAFPEVLILADLVSTLGVLPFYFDDWQIDLAITASQKGLRNPAGLALAAASQRAVAAMRPADPSDFRHWGNYFEAAARNTFPFTPPVSLLYGLEAAADLILSTTLPVVWNQAHLASRVFKQGITELGGEVLGHPSADALTAFRFPEKDMEAIRLALEEKGYLVAGGQGPWKGQILRVSHMGSVQVSLMEELLDTLKGLLDRMA